MLTPNLQSKFLTYVMTAETIQMAHRLTHEQTALLQNLRMETVEQKLNLSPQLSEEGKETYWQQEAYLRGQLSILDFLLEASAQLQADTEISIDSLNSPL